MCSYENRGLTGLVNLGNTCYINSSLQIISHVYELNEYINIFFQTNKEGIQKDINVVFLEEWKSLHTLMWSKNCIISPNRFIGVIQKMSKNKKNSLFMAFDQNDSTEFVYFLLSIFHDALKIAPDVQQLFTFQIQEYFSSGIKRSSGFIQYLQDYHKNNYSIIDALFGIYCKMDIVDCKTSKVLSSKYENFYMLDVALSSTTVEECLKHHFADEVMNKENDNQYFDDKENCYKDVVKKYSLYCCPKYLIIQLKRWNYNLKKNQRIIQYDLNHIDMASFVHDDRKNRIVTSYSLFGIINHSGNVYGGHYFSFIKNKNNKWYVYNDNQVREISSQKLMCNKNYCLIYRRNMN